MTESRSTHAGEDRDEQLHEAHGHEDAALPDVGDWSAGERFAEDDDGHQTTAMAGMRAAGERLQKSGTLSHDDWQAARREQIARRSNEFYTKRASIAAMQQKRNRRITLFVCVTAALAALALAAPIALQTYAPGYMEGLLDKAVEPQQANMTGSGSIYMTPPPPPREPAQAQIIAPEAAPPKSAPQAAGSKPVEAAARQIQPTADQVPAADPGLLYEAVTRPDLAGAIAPEPGALDVKRPAAGNAVAAGQAPEPAPEAVNALAPVPSPAAKSAEPVKLAALDPAPALSVKTAAPSASATSLVKKPTSPQPRKMGVDEARQLLERGDRLMKLGDVVSARALYSRALDADQANAALRLGSTFDPLIYQRIGVRGLQPDAGKAMEWYLTAAEAGNDNARRAYDALQRASAQQQ